MGSLQGILRIYCPRTKGGNHEDMMLEYQTDSPILGLATGEIEQLVGCRLGQSVIICFMDLNSAISDQVKLMSC